MTQIAAQIIADSVNPDRDRVTTYLLTFPRFILAELNTHRAFSRNTASSRAVPIAKLVEQVDADPAGPVRWGAAGPGMQDVGELPAEARSVAVHRWGIAAGAAVASARILARTGLHKQVVNRVLEPFAWTTSLVTATEYMNFFALRVHRDAQPEMQRLAYLMLGAYVASKPAERDWGEWHVPFGDRLPAGVGERERLAVAVARAARTSYTAFDRPVDHSADLALYVRLASSGHWSPFEHQAKAVRGRHANFAGWRQLRLEFAGERRTCDPAALLSEYEREMRIGENAAAAATEEVSPC